MEAAAGWRRCVALAAPRSQPRLRTEPASRQVCSMSGGRSPEDRGPAGLCFGFLFFLVIISPPLIVAAAFAACPAVIVLVRRHCLAATMAR